MDDLRAHGGAAAVLAMQGVRLTFRFGTETREDPGWVQARVTLEETGGPGFVVSGAVGLTWRDIEALVNVFDELGAMPARRHVPARRRWETFEALIEIEVEWSGGSGRVRGRFEPLRTGETSAEVDFVAGLDRTALLAFRDALHAGRPTFEAPSAASESADPTNPIE